MSALGGPSGFGGGPGGIGASGFGLGVGGIGFPGVFLVVTCGSSGLPGTFGVAMVGFGLGVGMSAFLVVVVGFCVAIGFLVVGGYFGVLGVGSSGLEVGLAGVITVDGSETGSWLAGGFGNQIDLSTHSW